MLEKDEDEEDDVEQYEVNESQDDLINTNPDKTNESNDLNENVFDPVIDGLKNQFALDRDDASVDELLDILKNRHSSIYAAAEGTDNIPYYKELFASRSKDKEALQNIREAVNYFTKQREIIESVTKPIFTEARRTNSQGNFDIRDIENISLIYMLDGKFKAKDEKELKELTNKISQDFLKYPNVNDETKKHVDLPQEYLDNQTNTVKNHLDMLNTFMIETAPKIIEKYDYEIDFTKMSKEDIVSLISYTVLTQTFIKKNTQEYRDYFNKKFDSYDKQVEFFKAINKVNTLNYLINEQLDKYGHIYKIEGIKNHIIGDFADVRLFTEQGIKSLVNFEKDNSHLEITLPKNYSNVQNTEDNIDLSSGLAKLLNPFLDSSERGSKIASPSYELIFIDGEPLQNIAYPKDPLTGLRTVDNNFFDYQTKMSNALKEAIDKQDKVIEIGYLTDYKNLVNVELKPVYFKSGNKQKEDAYAKLVESKQKEAPKRLDTAEGYVKKLCEKYADSKNNHVYANTVIVTKNQMHLADNINDLVRDVRYINLDNEVNNNIVNDLNVDIDNQIDNQVRENNVREERYKQNLDNLIDSLNDDFKNSLQLKEYKFDFSKVNSSPIYKDNRALQSVFSNIYKIEDYANILAGYISNVPGATFNKAIDRDLSAYFISLKGVSLTKRVEKSLIYVNAIKERDNGNFEPIREIQRELIDNFLNSRANCNFTKKSNIYNNYVDSHLSIVLQELLSKDEEFVQLYKETNPAKYYTLYEKFSELEVIDSANKQDIFRGLNFTSKYAAEPKNVETFTEFGTNLGRTVINVSRNVQALGNAIYESKFSNKTEVELNFDVSMFGVLGQNQKLPSKSLASDSIEILLETISEKSNYFGCEIDYDTALNTKEVALASTEVLLNTYASQKCSDQFTKDLLGKDELAPEDVLEFMYKSIYINNKSIYELAIDHVSEDFTLDRVGAAVFTKAMHDKNSVISMANLRYNPKGELETNVVVFKKNYDELVKQTKDNHGFFSRIGHALGLHKYNVEVMRDDYQVAEERFINNQTVEAIKLDFEANFNDNISNYKNKESIRAIHQEVAKDVEVNELEFEKLTDKERESLSKYMDDTNLKFKINDNLNEKIGKANLEDLEKQNNQIKRKDTLNK